MSYRRLAVLIAHLPMQSWTQTALRDEEPDSDLVNRDDEPHFGPWRLENYQLATLIDAVNGLIYATVAVAGGRMAAPKPVDRPGVKPDPVPFLSAAQIRKLESMHHRRGG